MSSDSKEELVKNLEIIHSKVCILLYYTINNNKLCSLYLCKYNLFVLFSIAS